MPKQVARLFCTLGANLSKKTVHRCYNEDCKGPWVLQKIWLLFGVKHKKIDHVRPKMCLHTLQSVFSSPQDDSEMVCIYIWSSNTSVQCVFKKYSVFLTFLSFSITGQRGRSKESKNGVFKRKANLMLFVIFREAGKKEVLLHSLKDRRAGFDLKIFSYLSLAKTIDRRWELVNW